VLERRALDLYLQPYLFTRRCGAAPLLATCAGLLVLRRAGEPHCARGAGRLQGWECSCIARLLQSACSLVACALHGLSFCCTLFACTYSTPPHTLHLPACLPPFLHLLPVPSLLPSREEAAGRPREQEGAIA